MNLLHLFRLIAAMIQVESGGNECAYNQTEQAAGCLQIKPIRVREAARLGINFTMEDRWDCEKSIRFFIEFQNVKKIVSYEEMARRWNGGQDGMSLNSTLIYWEKVQRELKK